MIISKFLTRSFLWFGILLLLSVSSCSTRANSKTLTYLMPENFEGGVVIVFAQKEGVTPDITENEIVFTIPADGILKVNVEAKEVSGKPRFFIVGKNGERTEIELLHNGSVKYSEEIRTWNDISDDERDNKNFVMTFERGNFNTANGVVRFNSFTVGKPKDGNLLVSRTHRKVGEVQRTFLR